MSSATVAAIPLAAQFLQTFDFEHRITMSVLRALPPDRLDFKPHERSWTGRELAWHIATSQYGLAAAVAAGRLELENPPAAPAALQEIVSGCETYYQQACELIARLTEEQLRVKIDLPGGKHIPAAALLWSGVLFHQIHHRGQLSIYIRLMGGRVPSIYGPSGDDTR